MWLPRYDNDDTRVGWQQCVEHSSALILFAPPPEQFFLININVSIEVGLYPNPLKGPRLPLIKIADRDRSSLLNEGL